MNENPSDEQLIREVTAAMHAEADALFGDDRLARQHARILQRIDQDGRPGRVIAFPAGQASVPSLLRTSPTTRWVAAAATLAFIVGLLAGQRLPREVQPASAPQVAANTNPTPARNALRASRPLVVSDEEFLGEIEAAAQSRPTVLQHLDALTPRAWDVGQ